MYGVDDIPKSSSVVLTFIKAPSFNTLLRRNMITVLVHIIMVSVDIITAFKTKTTRTVEKRIDIRFYEFSTVGEGEPRGRSLRNERTRKKNGKNIKTNNVPGSTRPSTFDCVRHFRNMPIVTRGRTILIIGDFTSAKRPVTSRLAISACVNVFVVATTAVFIRFSADETGKGIHYRRI